MGFFDRLGRLVRANANAAVSSMEDPSKILDQSVADMQSDLVKLRQAVALAIASQKRLSFDTSSLKVAPRGDAPGRWPTALASRAAFWSKSSGLPRRQAA